MRPAFLACGFQDVTCKVNLATGAGLVRGDVLLNTVHHTAMFCGNHTLVQASINEKGGAVGGVPGDQTGREFWIRSYYNYPWNCVLRYPEAAGSTKISVEEVAKGVIAGRYGNGSDRKAAIKALGLDYTAVQKRVNEILKGQAKKSVDQIAKEVLQGRWGNGADRRKRITEAGYDYAVVQKKVNEMLR